MNNEVNNVTNSEAINTEVINNETINSEVINDNVQDEVESTKNTGNKKIIFIFLGVLCILLLLLYFVLIQHKSNLFGNNKCKCENMQANIDDFESNGAKKSFDLEKIEFGYIDKKTGDKYVRIKLSVTNNTDKETDMNVYSLELADSERNNITLCHSASTIDDSAKVDILPGTIPANGTISGYLYCKTDIMDAHLLRISYVTRVYLKDSVWQHDYQVLNIIFTEEGKSRG